MGDVNPKVEQLILTSDPHRIGEVDEFLETALSRHGVPNSIITDLAIVTTELVNNAIIHGNKQDVSKTVTLTISFTDKQVEIRVTDQSEEGRFNPDSLPDPLAEENLLKEVGRGVFIVRSLMDEVVFEDAPGGGTAVVVRKSLTPE